MWQIVNGIDFEGGKENLNLRSIFLEFQMLLSSNIDLTKMPAYISSSIEMAEKLPSPRVIKSHLPFCLLPPNLLDTARQVVYVCRNPKVT